jgi:hypothetical protein
MYVRAVDDAPTLRRRHNLRLLVTGNVFRRDLGRFLVELQTHGNEFLQAGVRVHPDKPIPLVECYLRHVFPNTPIRSSLKFDRADVVKVVISDSHRGTGAHAFFCWTRLTWRSRPTPRAAL